MSIRKFLPLLLCFCVLACTLPCVAAKPKKRDDLAGETFFQITTNCHKIDPNKVPAEDYFGGKVPRVDFGTGGRGVYCFYDFTIGDLVPDTFRYTVDGNVVKITLEDDAKDKADECFEIKMEIRDDSLVVTEMPKNNAKFQATVVGDIFELQDKTEDEDISENNEAGISGLRKNYEIVKGDSLALAGKITAPDGKLIISVELSHDNPNFSRVTKEFGNGVESFDLSKLGKIPSSYPLNTVGTHDFELRVTLEDVDGGHDEMSLEFTVTVTAEDAPSHTERAPEPSEEDKDIGSDKGKNSGIITVIVIVAVLSAVGLVGAIVVMVWSKNKFATVPPSAPVPKVPPMVPVAPKTVYPVSRGSVTETMTKEVPETAEAPEVERYCSKCGKKVKPDDRMCKRCGLIFTKPTDTYIKDENGGADSRHGGEYFSKPPKI